MGTDNCDILERTRKGTLDVTPRCSHDTALRDIQNLIDEGLRTNDEGGGRSTSYALILGGET